MDEASPSSTGQASDGARDPRDALIDELRRRNRNNFAVIRSIAIRSARADMAIDDYVDRLTRRIGALARAQALSDSGTGAGIDLELLFADELLAHAARIGEHAVLEGPRTLVGGRTAELIALAAHELASNATEYGALGSAGGRVFVRWRRDGERLRLEWRETLEPRPSEFGASGLGHMLLTRMLVYELDAEVELALGDEGLVCAIALPLGRDVDVTGE